jgi:hypothetical protein
MDTRPLVSDEIDAGAEFVRRFNEFAPVTLAFWLKPTEESRWAFYLVSDKITPENKTEAYREVLRCAAEQHSPFLSPFQITLLSADSPLAKAALNARGHHPADAFVRSHGPTLGGIGIDDSYIYPLQENATAG